MTVKAEPLPEESVILIEVHPPVNANTDPTEATRLTREFQQQLGTDICRVTDYTRVKLTFADVVSAMALDKVFRDPHVHNVFIGTDELVDLVAEAYKQEQYGDVEVPVFSSREEAIQKAREMLGKG